MNKENSKRLELEPKFIVTCDDCDFSYSSKTVSMVERVSLEEIGRRHSKLYPEHEVHMYELVRPN